MKYTDEQIAELKSLGYNDADIEKAQDAGIEFETAKAMAESAATKAKELADEQAKAKAKDELENGLVERNLQVVNADREKAAKTRKAVFNAEGGSSNETLEKAKALGLNPDSPQFKFALDHSGRASRKDFGHDKGREFTPNEKAALFMTGQAIKAMGERDYGTMKRINDMVRQDYVEKGLITNVAHFGGFLVPTEFLQLFVEKRDEVSPYRALVDVVNVSSMSGEFPVEDDGVTVYRRAEGAAGTASRPRFNQVTYSITSKFALTVVTYELLQTNQIGLAQWLIGHFARKMALKEWSEFILGSGSGAPRGLANTSIPNTAAAANSPMLFTDVNLGFRALPVQYRDRAVWIMRDDREGSIESIKDSSNRPIFIPSDGTLGFFPGILKGKRVYINNNITENTAATPKSVIYFGDPFYYKHFELAGLSFEDSREATITDESGASVSLFQSNQVAFKAWTNDDAKLALPESFATLTNVP